MKKINGAMVTKFREKYGWTKTHLGELLGVSQQSITDIEYNRNKTEPTREFQNNLAEVLGVSVSDFYSEENDIEYNFKPSGSRNSSPFKKIEFGIEQFLNSSKQYDVIVEVERIGIKNSRMDAYDFVDLYGDRRIRGINTEIEKEVTSTYRNDELIYTDETLSSVVVLYVKANKKDNEE